MAKRWPIRSVARFTAHFFVNRDERHARCLKRELVCLGRNYTIRENDE